jgi:protein-S-isoprenylcysteine O-methyltransferase Ste14
MTIVITRPSEILELIWIVWLVSWMAASFWTGRTQRRIGNLETWTYRAVIIAGGVLLVPWSDWLRTEKSLWPVGYDTALALAAVMVAGLSFTWWARIHLGRLWSSAITRKVDHRIIDTGPYGIVRHPIYTGIIVGLVATAAAEATATALVGAALTAFGLWLKARSEERFLMTELGPDAYRGYCGRVPMLIPFLLRR